MEGGLFFYAPTFISHSSPPWVISEILFQKRKELVRSFNVCFSVPTKVVTDS